MSIDKNVREFVAEFLDISPDNIKNTFDVITDVDWNEYEPDENIGELLEDFVARFEIYVPERDFVKYSRKKGLSKITAFFLRPIFPFIWEKMAVEHLQIGEMIKIAHAKYWGIGKS